MTREEAKKLMKPLVWEDWNKFWDAATIVLSEEKDINLFAGKQGFKETEWSVDVGEEVIYSSYSVDPKAAAEKWYQDFVLGFLDLEGGEG